MRKLKLIYNPFSGDRAFKNSLDDCIKVFQSSGCDVHIFRSMQPGDIDGHISLLAPDEYSSIVIAGGDGSVNIALNSMLRYNINSALGIIPSGTANDFASYLRIPREYDKAAQIIANGKLQKTDVGMVNDKFFINVCAAGLLSNVSQIVDPGFKNTFGKLAYYIKGLEQLPSLMPLPMRITTASTVIEEELYWFTILNSSGAGGFDRLSPGAETTDGLFDFVGIKAMPLRELALLFIKMLASGDYLSDSNVIFLREDWFKVEYGGNDPKMLATDTDGERGPDMPIEVKNLRRRLDIHV